MEKIDKAVDTLKGIQRISEGNKEYESSVKIDFLGVKMLVTMPKEVLDPFLKRAPSILPAVSAAVTDANYDVYIYSEFGKPALVVQDNIVYMYMSNNVSNRQFAMDVLLASSKFLEKMLNLRGIYSLHAASIAYENKATVILGQQGAGKTTVSMSCCYIDKDISLISGSRFFVQKDSVVAAIDSVDLRKGSIIVDLNKNLRGISSTPAQQDKGQEDGPWDQRILVTPEDAKIKINKTYPIEIRDFVLVKRLPKTLSVVGDKQLERDSFLTRVYDSLFMFTEQMPWYVSGSKIPYPDVFGEEMRQQRLNFGDSLLGHKPYVYLEGNLEDISSYIIKQLKNSK